jgi:mono/diheme cytochrome c family protein
MTLDGRWMVGLLVLVLGCEPAEEGGYEPDPQVSGDDDDSAGDDDDDDDDAASGPVYADVEPILEEHCTSCHGSPLAGGAPFALDTFALASDKADRIVARAVDGDPSPMPPGNLALSDAEAEILVEWAEAGAPRN